MSTTQDEYDDVAGLEAGLAAGFDEYAALDPDDPEREATTSVSLFEGDEGGLEYAERRALAGDRRPREAPYAGRAAPPVMRQQLHIHKALSTRDPGERVLRGFQRPPVQRPELEVRRPFEPPARRVYRLHAVHGQGRRVHLHDVSLRVGDDHGLGHVLEHRGQP